MAKRSKKETAKIKPFFMRAEISSESINAESRTVDMVWSTGEKVLRGGWFTDPFWEELSMDPKNIRMGRMNNGAPLLQVHDSRSLDSVVGVVEKTWFKDGKGYSTVRFAKDPTSDSVFQKVQDKILRNVSVGYQVHKFEKVKTDQTDNQEIKTLRAIDWEPFEVSIVPIGADAGAGFRSESLEANTCELINRAESAIEEEVMPPEDKTPVTAPDVTRAAELELAKKEAAKLAKEAGEVAAIAERTRSLEIRNLCKTHKLEDSFSEQLVKDGVQIEDARAKVLEALAKRDSEVVTNGQVTVTKDESEKKRDGASQWLIQRSGQAPLVEGFTKKPLDGGEFRGMTLLDFARESLEKSGIKTRGMDKMTLVGKALTLRTGMNSTGDFAVLMENTLHKILQAAYATTPDTWSRFCAKGTVSDFRAHNRYREGTFGRLEVVPEGGEFKHKQVPDGRKETITADTKGNIVILSRQAIINDDMNIFSQLGVKLGRAAKLSIEMDVYDALKSNSSCGPLMHDGKALFHADHGNIGSSAAISVASIDADRVIMASQTDESGNEILDLRPSVLVLPVGLGGTAKVINRSAYDPDTANKLQRPNMVQGLFADIVDTPRLTGTTRFMFADPGIAACLEVAFLDGQDNPFLESRNEFNVDGTSWKVRLDYGVAGVDYRGAVKNAGT